MAEDKRNFVRGVMDKSSDERLVQDGTYIDALNIRVSSEENDDNHVENPLGNTKLTTLYYDGVELENAETIGSFADTTNNTIYWFVTKPGVVDMIVSYNALDQVLMYHIVDDNGILNFSTDRRINDIDKIGDLLFWTQQDNPPRYINVKRPYLGLIEDDINVIVAPPLEPPTISMIKLPTQENYLEDRFVCFAYRYKYLDNQYSALSQFSEPAFAPGAFVLDGYTYQNSGMKNEYNGVSVTFDTGNKNVQEIELCFKLSDSNIINVIGRYNKNNNGWSDNQLKSLVFSNRKIYTTLPESELLRLYDNVPRFAIAQTVMSNRLFYGNYTDGYNIVDENGRNIKIDYTCDVIYINDQAETLTTALGNGTYTFGTAATVINDTILLINMAPAVSGGLLKKGSLFSFTITIQHSQFATYPTVSPPSQQGTLELTFLFNFKQDYDTLAQMIASEDFNAVLGTSSSYVAAASDACNNFSFADIFNCSISDITGYDKESSGITSYQQGFAIQSSPSSILSIQVPAMKFKQTGAGTGVIYEYFEIVSASALISNTSTPKSLHSNRDYDIGIVYEDEYARSTTALTSINNSVYIPASASITQNGIRVTLKNKAPAWATKYKFVAKSSKLGYETIYSAIYYSEEPGNRSWIKLDGDNVNKVIEGDILILKADASGPTNRVIQKKVLEIKTQAADFISGGVSELAGVYMLMDSSELNITPSENSIVDYGNKSVMYPSFIRYSINIGTSPYTIPSGSIVRFIISFDRDTGPGCPGQSYYLDASYTAKKYYNNLYDFVIGENIKFLGGESEGSVATTIFNPILISGTSDPSLSFIQGTNQIQFGENTATGEMFLCVAPGVENCFTSISARYSRVSCRIVVQRAVNLLVFETTPLESDADLFYEESASYDIISYNHQGNVQNQNYATGVPAIIDLAFFDCFTFGNGVESYKALDALTGRHFNLGNRFYSVSQQDYKQADRIASITYSGKYNQETNLNKLNEFNLGLVNYYDLDIMFGAIMKMFGRRNDINVLQEDKISYVLSDKSLINEAAEGGAITSSPEVLGTQIARLENFGISKDPESFASYGSLRFFTDSKRGVVLMLDGSSYQEPLVIISDALMSQYFRALFDNTKGKFKLGGYDPYNSEYVLSFTDNGQSQDVTTYPCGIKISAQRLLTSKTYTVDFGSRLGNSAISLDIHDGSAYLVITYNGVAVTTTTSSSSTGATISKDNASVDTMTVEVVPVTFPLTYTLTIPCPDPKRLKLVKVVAASPDDLNKFTHITNSWAKNGVSSPTDVTSVQLATTPNSYYNLIEGEASVGAIPVDGGDTIVGINTLQGDDFVFDVTKNRFMFLATNTLYANTEADINSLIAYIIANNNGTTAGISTILENPSAGTYYATFQPNTNPYEYLYLIWNFKKATELVVCYDVDNIDNVCEC